MLGFGVATVGGRYHGTGGVDHLSLAARGARRNRVSRHVPAGRAAAGLRPRALWAWLNMPIPIYGTLWLLALAYFTVMLPLGVRTLAGVVRKSTRASRSAPASAGPGGPTRCAPSPCRCFKPGILAAWLLIFMAVRARARRVGVPDGAERQGDRALDRQCLSQPAAPSSTAAMALIQTCHGDGGAGDPVPADARHRRGNRRERRARTGSSSSDLVIRYGDASPLTASASMSAAAST